jgi:hypothetical protein
MHVHSGAQNTQNVSYFENCFQKIKPQCSAVMQNIVYNWSKNLPNFFWNYSTKIFSDCYEFSHLFGLLFGHGIFSQKFHCVYVVLRSDSADV